MKGKCIYLDNVTNCCSLHYQTQCEGQETCEDYEEEDE